jgi:hypothetical protein
MGTGIDGLMTAQSMAELAEYTETLELVQEKLDNLGNVDNTSDADKPVSTAQAQAIQAIAAQVNPHPYKGANNQAGILIDLGAEIIGGMEILFCILYNETISGKLIRQAFIHGQFYGDISRTGMVQDANVQVPVYIFKGTSGGIGNTNTYIWIPSSNTAYFPSARVEAWAKTGTGIFDVLPVTVSTLAASPVEVPVAITNTSAWVDVPYTASDGVDLSFNFYVKYNAALNVLTFHFDNNTITTFTIGMTLANITLPKSISGTRRFVLDIDIFTGGTTTGRQACNINVKTDGRLNIFPVIPTQGTGAITALNGCKVFGDGWLYLG